MFVETSSHVHHHGDVVGELRIDIGSEVVAGIVEIVHVTLLLEGAEGREKLYFLGAPSGAHVMVRC